MNQLQRIYLPKSSRFLSFLLAGTAFFILSVNSSLIRAEVLWSTSHETGDLRDWYLNEGGGVFNTGGSNAIVSVTEEAAHTGRYAVKMEVWGIEKQVRACRIFRWGEQLKEGYFSSWMMFPTLPTVNGWLNIFQFKKKNYATGAIDPTWYNEIKNKNTGTNITLTHWNQQWDIAPTLNAPPILSAGEWFHVEWYYKDGINDGEIEIRINGLTVWHLRNVNTRGVASDIQWSPCLYGVNVQPDHLIMYMDDAVIGTTWAGPNFFDQKEGKTPPGPPKNLRIVKN